MVDKAKSPNTLIEKLRPSKKGEKIKATYIAFILDESGSMSSGYDLTVKSFNDQVEVVKKNESAGGKTRLSFYTFNDQVKEHYNAEAVSQVQPLGAHNYKPCGGTALYDAVGSALEQLKKLPQPNEDAAFLVCVFTDGEENSSRWVNGAALGQEVRRLQETGDWTFTLMGPQTGLMSLSDLLGIAADNVAGFDPGNIRSRQVAGSMESVKMGAYMSARSMGTKAMANMYSASASAEMGSLLDTNLVSSLADVIKGSEK